MEIRRFGTVDEAVAFTAENFLRTANSRIEESGVFRTAFSGGNTPLPWFTHMARNHANSVDWKRVEVYWVDERWVENESGENNYGNAWRSWLNQIPTLNFPIPTQAITIDESRKYYENLLKEKFGDQLGFDWALLGAGTDGHTASIFQAVTERSNGVNRVIHTRHPVSGQDRISLSLNFLKKSSVILMLLTGEEKRFLLNSIIRADRPDSPAQQVLTSSGQCIVVTDISE